MKRAISKILVDNRPLIKLAVFAIADSVLISLSIYTAFLLRFETAIPLQHFINIEGMILLALAVIPPVFYFLRLYYFAWNYVSANELISIVKATTLSFLLLVAIFFVLRDLPVFAGFPRSTLFISYFLIILGSGAIRFAKRIYLHLFNKKEDVEKERTLIVGAGDAGEQILRSMLSSTTSTYFPIGFVDDSKLKQNVAIHGYRVLGSINDIPAIVREHKAEKGTLIIALPSASSGTIRNAVEKGREAGLKKIKVIPPISEVIQSGITLQTLREVQVEDLLGREPVALDTNSIEAFIRNKRVMITGAAGSIGSELCRQVASFQPNKLLILDQDETGIFNISDELKKKFPKVEISSFVADIQDEVKIEIIFKQVLPETVFHAAAYKHVPLMEDHPEEAVKNNIFGTKVVAESSIKCRTDKFILISTDKAVNPVSIMGASKRAGEMICQALNGDGITKFISVRFGNVLDSRGSVIPIFRDQIKRGGPVEITHPDMKRYFMTTPEACLLVMQAGAMGQGGEVFVLDMGNAIKIVDLAKEMIRLCGFEPDREIPIVFTEPRPGEKLFEDILTAEEGTVATQNKKIYMAKLFGGERQNLYANLELLKQAARECDKEGIVRVLQGLIPNASLLKEH